MARIRSIHPSACTSEKLAKTSGDEERCYWRLQTHCDDEGRAEDHPRLIWAALFPLNEDVGPQDVDKWLQGLHDLGLICRYEVDGRRYLCVVGWAEKQSPRHPSPSKFPAPPEGYGEPPRSYREEREDGRGEREEDGGSFLGEGARAEARAPEDYGADFEAWWAVYPKKLDKAAAEKTYRTKRKRHVADDLLAAATHYAQWAEAADRQFVKYPKTFLNQSWREWVDGIPPDLRPAALEELATPAREKPPWVCVIGNPQCKDGYIDVPGESEVFECSCLSERVS